MSVQKCKAQAHFALLNLLFFAITSARLCDWILTQSMAPVVASRNDLLSLLKVLWRKPWAAPNSDDEPVPVVKQFEVVRKFSQFITARKAMRGLGVPP